MFACRYGHIEIVKYLHQKGALIEREKRYTPLHTACYGGDVDVV